MRFRRGARLDTGQVRDVRGRGMGGGGSRWAAAGSASPSSSSTCSSPCSRSEGGLGQLAPLEDQRVGQGDTPSEVSTECQTGEDANTRQDCRIVAVVNSVQKFWDGVFTRSGKQYPYADTVFFTDQVQTGCGFASSQVGPFYCPEDQLVYIDLDFFDELQSRFGAGGDLRAGLCARARVRPPRAEPARRPGQHPRRPAGAGEQGRAVGAAGRLLRRACGRRTRSRPA